MKKVRVAKSLVSLIPKGEHPASTPAAEKALRAMLRAMRTVDPEKKGRLKGGSP